MRPMVSDGNQILHVLIHILILLCDMGYQPQIPFYQYLLRFPGFYAVIPL